MVAVAAIKHPNLVIIDGKYKFNDSDREIMLYKIRIILTIAAKFQHDCVILSAFGCGAYRNPPEEVALLFREVLNSPQFKGRFLKVIFSIFNDHNANHDTNPHGNTLPFANVFEQNIIYDKESLA